MDGLLLVMSLEGLRPNAKHAVELDGYGWGSIARLMIMLMNDLDH